MNMISNLKIIPREKLTLDARLYLAYTDRSKGAANTSFSQATAFEGLTVDPKVNSSLLPGSGSVLDEVLKRLNETSEKNYTYRVRANMGLTYNIHFRHDFFTLTEGFINPPAKGIPQPGNRPGKV